MGRFDLSKAASLPEPFKAEIRPIRIGIELGGSTGSPRTILGGSSMKISPEKLAVEAEATGFGPDVLKVAQLLGRQGDGLLAHEGEVGLFPGQHCAADGVDDVDFALGPFPVLLAVTDRQGWSSPRNRIPENAPTEPCFCTAGVSSSP